ncbi:MAG TPA: hypothetical protein VF529_13625 [Solirubrobacteraceae bacterium]|jgi:hypothetical protein
MRSSSIKRVAVAAVAACALTPGVAAAQDPDAVGVQNDVDARCGAVPLGDTGGGVAVLNGGADTGEDVYGPFVGALPETQGTQDGVDQSVSSTVTSDNGVVEDPGTPDESTVCDRLVIGAPTEQSSATPPYDFSAGSCGTTMGVPAFVDGNARIRGYINAQCWFTRGVTAVVTLRACLQKRLPLTGDYTTVSGGCSSYRSFYYPNNTNVTLFTPRVPCDAGRSNRMYRTYGIIAVKTANGFTGYRRRASQPATLACVT